MNLENSTYIKSKFLTNSLSIWKIKLYKVRVRFLLKHTSGLRLNPVCYSKNEIQINFYRVKPKYIQDKRKTMISDLKYKDFCFYTKIHIFYNI